MTIILKLFCGTLHLPIRLPLPTGFFNRAVNNTETTPSHLATRPGLHAPVHLYFPLNSISCIRHTIRLCEKKHAGRWQTIPLILVSHFRVCDGFLRDSCFWQRDANKTFTQSVYCSNSMVFNQTQYTTQIFINRATTAYCPLQSYHKPPPPNGPNRTPGIPDYGSIRGGGYGNPLCPNLAGYNRQTGVTVRSFPELTAPGFQAQ